MHDLRHILATRTRLRDRGEEAVLATVVKTEGSTYRRPGARLLIGRSGDSVGGVSGGCLEGDLVRKAWWRTEDGPAVVVYDSRADDETAWQFGLGCNGVAHVLLERLSPDAADDGLAFVEHCVRDDECGVMVTVCRADAATGLAVGQRLTLDARGERGGGLRASEIADELQAGAEACRRQDQGRTAVYAMPTGEVEVAFEVVRPPVRLLVFGGGFDALPVVAAAKAIGWETVVIDRRPARRNTGADRTFALPPAVACERLRPMPRTAAVVMNHNFPDDREAVEALLRTDVRYVGVLGPKARTQKMLADMPHATGLDRLHAPIGLDIGADTPEEIAAAVVAQAIAVFAGRDGGHLRDRAGPIHRREPAGVAEAVS